MKSILLLLLASTAGTADVVFDCDALARNPNGSLETLPCTQSPLATPNGVAITASARSMSVSVVNFLNGGIHTETPGATIDYVVRSVVSDSQQLIVTGGTGSGKLVFSAYSEFGSWLPYNAQNTANRFLSDFLPVAPPTHLDWGPSYGNAVMVDFTFNVPFSFTVYSEIEYRTEWPFEKDHAYWEALHYWDLSLIDIVDAEGQSAVSANVATVPEPWAFALLVPVALWACVAARRLPIGPKQSRIPDDRT